MSELSEDQVSQSDMLQRTQSPDCKLYEESHAVHVSEPSMLHSMQLGVVHRTQSPAWRV